MRRLLVSSLVPYDNLLDCNEIVVAFERLILPGL